MGLAVFSVFRQLTSPPDPLNLKFSQSFQNLSFSFTSGKVQKLTVVGPLVEEERPKCHQYVFFVFFYKIHILCPDTGVNHGVWCWGPFSSADQRSRLHSSMDAPKGYWVGRIRSKKKTEERNWKDCIAQ